MDFVSVRVITDDVERLATFWEQLTGLPATRPVPVFAELQTPTGIIAIGAPATVGMLGAAAPVPGQNRSIFIELRVDDVDATWERVTGLVPRPSPRSCWRRPTRRGATARSSCAIPTADWSTCSLPSPRRPRRSTAFDPWWVPTTTRGTHRRGDLELPRQARNRPHRKRAGLTN